MIFIDASQVHLGGAFVLLELLVKELRKKKIPFYILKDTRLKKHGLKADEYTTIKVNFLNRKKVYLKLIDQLKPKTILCFGNFPPPIKIKNSNIKTVTYFHNPHLLDKADINNFSIKFKIINVFKKIYLNFYKNNTDHYIFQTPFIKDSFIESYSYPQDQCEVFPFYDSDKI